MNRMLRMTAGMSLLLMLSAGCNNSDDKKSTPSASLFSCINKKADVRVLCTEYQDLTGSTLTGIQSECELRSSEGYSWAVAACPASTVGTCSLPVNDQKPVTSTQYYYESFDKNSAAGMCEAQKGTFK